MLIELAAIAKVSFFSLVHSFLNACDKPRYRDIMNILSLIIVCPLYSIDNLSTVQPVRPHNQLQAHRIANVSNHDVGKRLIISIICFRLCSKLRLNLHIIII